MTSAPLLPEAPTLPSTQRATWLVARRAAIESLSDRSTRFTSAFFALALPTIFELSLIQPEVRHSHVGPSVGALMAVYALIVGLGPSSSAISIASGVFAGEMEKGNLAPLLATPASNTAIFAGKVMGAVLPAFIYAAVAETVYFAEIAALNGPGKLSLLPLGLTVAMLVMVPAIALLSATIASLISTRARTYTAAQTVTSLVLVPVMGGLIGLAFVMRSWPVWWIAAGVAALLAVDLTLIAVTASRWRREEILAQQ